MLSVTKSKSGKYEDGSGKECMVPKKKGAASVKIIKFNFAWVRNCGWRFALAAYWHMLRIT